jgi:predicted permease
MDFHREAARRELERAGADPRAASLAARRSFGNAALASEQARDVWGFAWLQGLGQDLRLAGRTLRATPVLTAAAALSLALGIGANTAIFSIVDGLLLRGLPVAAPERLVTISSGDAAATNDVASWSYPVFERLREFHLFDGIAASATTRFNLAPRGEAEFIDGLWANGEFFNVLGVHPWIGRTFAGPDDQRGGGPDGPVAVLSYAFWQRQFGGAREAIGGSLTLEGVPVKIIGVMPPDFFGVTVGRTFDVILPFGDEPILVGSATRLDLRGFYWLTLIGRLKPAQTLAAANAALQGVEPQVREATRFPLPAPYAAQYLAGSHGFALVRTASSSSDLTRRFASPLLAIMIVVLIVLLIACANVANLLLARTNARQHEMSVRRALGASRWRLVRQLFAESATLALAGAVPGVLFASWFAQALVHQLSTRTATVFLDVSIDRRVLLFTLIVTCVVTAVFGVAPALRGASSMPADALRTAGRSTTGDGRSRVTSVFLIAQVSLSIVLVITAGLFVRTFWALSNRDLGFAAGRVLIASVNTQRAGVAPAARLQLYEQLREAVGRVPGVSDAALSTLTPVGRVAMAPHIDVPGGVEVADPGSLTGNSRANVISPGWLRTLGTALVAGRDFSDRDRDGAPRVALVNEALARTFLPGTNPLGRVVTVTMGPSTDMEIVGVVADAVYSSPRELPQPTLYMPLAQAGSLPANVALVIHTTASPGQMSHEVARAMASVNPNLVLTFQPMADQVDGAMVQERLIAILSGFFGALALVLAGIGLYGVTAYAVSRRRREIGLRMALGARAGEVVVLVLKRVFVLVGLGALIGTVVSMWAAGLAATLLYGIKPHDPATLVGAIVVLVTISLVAAGLPAWRASRMDPAAELRND